MTPPSSSVTAPLPEIPGGQRGAAQRVAPGATRPAYLGPRWLRAVNNGPSPARAMGPGGFASGPAVARVVAALDRTPEERAQVLVEVGVPAAEEPVARVAVTADERIELAQLRPEHRLEGGVGQPRVQRVHDRRAGVVDLPVVV